MAPHCEIWLEEERRAEAALRHGPMRNEEEERRGEPKTAHLLVPASLNRGEKRRRLNKQQRMSIKIGVTKKERGPRVQKKQYSFHSCMRKGRGKSAVQLEASVRETRKKRERGVSHPFNDPL